MLEKFFIKDNFRSMDIVEIRKELVKQLKDGNRFWSYDTDSVKDVPDDILIEKVLIYLDLKDIDKLFKILPYNVIKKSWREHVIPLGSMYYALNRFLAWYYFNIKDPGKYVKSVTTRHLNCLKNEGISKSHG